MRVGHGRSVEWRTQVVLATLVWFAVYVVLYDHLSFLGELLFLAALGMTCMLLECRFKSAGRTRKGGTSP